MYTNFEIWFGAFVTEHNAINHLYEDDRTIPNANMSLSFQAIDERCSEDVLHKTNILPFTSLGMRAQNSLQAV